MKVTETLRVSLDAGSQLDHYVATFKHTSMGLSTGAPSDAQAR